MKNKPIQWRKVKDIEEKLLAFDVEIWKCWFKSF